MCLQKSANMLSLPIYHIRTSCKRFGINISHLVRQGHKAAPILWENGDEFAVVPIEHVAGIMEASAGAAEGDAGQGRARHVITWEEAMPIKHDLGLVLSRRLSWFSLNAKSA